MEFDIDIQGLDGIDMALDGLADEIMPAVAKGLQSGAEDIVSTAQDLVHPDTGQLRSSIAAGKPVIKDNVAEIKVVAGAEYALYVEMGTGPVGAAHHEGIDPKADPTYTTHGWVYPTKDGGFRYTEGQPARPFMYPAYKANEKNVKAEVAKEIRKAVEE